MLEQSRLGALAAPSPAELAHHEGYDPVTATCSALDERKLATHERGPQRRRGIVVTLAP